MMTLAVHYFCAFLDFSMICERQGANPRGGEGRRGGAGQVELWALLSAGFFIIVCANRMWPRDPDAVPNPNRPADALQPYRVGFPFMKPVD